MFVEHEYGLYFKRIAFGSDAAQLEVMLTWAKPWMVGVFGAFVYPFALCVVAGCVSAIGGDSYYGWQGFTYGFSAGVPLTLLSAACVELRAEGNGIVARWMGGVAGFAGAVVMVVAFVRDHSQAAGLMLPLCWCAALILGAFFSKRSDWVK